MPKLPPDWKIESARDYTYIQICAKRAKIIQNCRRTAEKRCRGYKILILPKIIGKLPEYIQDKILVYIIPLDQREKLLQEIEKEFDKIHLKIVEKVQDIIEYCENVLSSSLSENGVNIYTSILKSYQCKLEIISNNQEEGLNLYFFYHIYRNKTPHEIVQEERTTYNRSSDLTGCTAICRENFTYYIQQNNNNQDNNLGQQL